MDNNQAKTVIDVQTGEVEAGSGKVVLRSDGIGSCVVIAAFDTKAKIGAIAHVMLPGRAPKESTPQKLRYAANAIDEVIKKMSSLGAEDMCDVGFCLIGGGNVLKRADDKVSKDNIDSVVEILSSKGMRVVAESLGGEKRRSATLNVETGCVSFSEGDDSERVLWEARLTAI